jgi:hypothetical protein
MAAGERHWISNTKIIVAPEIEDTPGFSEGLAIVAAGIQDAGVFSEDD